MIYDLNTIKSGEGRSGYDVCIIGAGVAGITLAIKLAERGKRILLLEAGDMQFDTLSQDIYKGESIGRDYYPLEITRLRYLGGTSNHWEGKCRPFDSIDFSVRDHIPDSGWPINKSDLDPFLQSACEILEIPQQFGNEPVEGSQQLFDSITFQWSTPVRFGQKYKDQLQSSKNIDLFLNANVIDIKLNDNTDHVETVRCANYKEPDKYYSFSSKVFVMAMGAIENPRMLLNFRSQLPNGIGNKNDLVGRYFMEHYAAHGGYYVTDKNIWPFEQKEAFFAATQKLTEQLGMGSARLQVAPLFAPGPGIIDKAKHRIICSERVIHDFISSFKDVWCPIPVYSGGYLHVVCEQSPNPNSRVELSEKTDRFGLKRTKLDWQSSEIDRNTIKQIVMAFGAYMVKQNIGNVKMVDWMLDDSSPIPGVGQDKWHGAGFHQMGTTRMSDTDKTGVVDKNCRVFGIDNLYIAGSSVFATSGHANPTFTIVQLALRLSEHLDRYS